jgi:hypothetical protein
LMAAIHPHPQLWILFNKSGSQGDGAITVRGCVFTPSGKRILSLQQLNRVSFRVHVRPGLRHHASSRMILAQLRYQVLGLAQRQSRAFRSLTAAIAWM